MTVKDKEILQHSAEFGNFHTHLKHGKPAKRLGWPSIHPVTLELGNGLLIYRNLTRKIAFN